MRRDHDWIYELAKADDDIDALAHLAKTLERGGMLHAAASAWDRAYGLVPGDARVATRRAEILDHLAREHRGLTFRYVPRGTFLMGTDDPTRDADEHPAHPVHLEAFWISETPVSWTDYCRLLGWAPPPQGWPDSESLEDMAGFHLHEENKIRLQYCEDETRRAGDWHMHAHTHPDLFGEPDRGGATSAPAYRQRPMVAVSWQSAEELCARLCDDRVTVALPTEAQWEKAARGGRVGCPYPWGLAPPDASRCDFDNFDDYHIQPMRRFAPNGYGLYAMSGGVWEWTRDWYDAAAYGEGHPRRDPTGPASGLERVLRGGSWADCGAAVTVTARMSLGSRSWRDACWGRHETANSGFRLVLRPQTMTGDS